MSQSDRTVEQRIESYVDELLEGIAIPLELRDEAREDYIAHLEAEIETLQQQGMLGERALLVAIERLGTEHTLRRELETLAAKRRRGSPRGAGGGPVGGARAPLYGLLGDLAHGLRNLVVAPGFALVAILTVALGVGTNTAVFTLFHGVILRPLAYPAEHEIVRVWPEKVFNEEMLRQVGERTQSFAGLSGYRPVRLTLTGAEQAEVLTGAVVHVDHFSVLGVGVALGRAFEEEDCWAAREDVAILSHGLWVRRFGATPAALASTVDLGGVGHSRRRIVGVLPADYQPLVPGTQVWVPLAMDPESPGFGGAYGLRALARLAAGVTVQTASAEVRGLVPDFERAHATQFRDGRRSPVDVVRLRQAIGGGVRLPLALLLGAVGLVLLVACSNVANLLLARTAGRRRELAIRAALGASRGRLVRQLLVESALLGLLGGVVGALMAAATLKLLAAQLFERLPRAIELGLDLPVLLFAALITLNSSLLFGVVPALRATSLTATLSSGGRTASTEKQHHRLNRSLVVAEIALCLVLVTAAGLLVKSFWRLHAVDVGFVPDRLLTFRLELPPGRYGEAEARRDYFERLFDRLGALPQVRSAGAINLLPLAGGNVGIPYLAEGEPLPAGTPSLVGNLRVVTGEYLATLGMRLLRGRTFTAGDHQAAEPVALINEAMARRHWREDGPLGKRILSVDGEPQFTVVGVVSDIQQGGLDIDSLPELYLPAAQADWLLSSVVVRLHGDPEEARALVDSTVRDLDPNVPINDLRTMPDVIRSSLGDSRFYTGLFASFAGLALVLGVIGVYGVIAYTTGARTRELGLRVALGSTSGGVLRFAMARAMGPVLLGVALGLILAFAVTRLLASLLFEVGATDPLVFASVALLLVLVGAAASFLPAWRAARADPVLALRGD